MDPSSYNQSQVPNSGTMPPYPPVAGQQPVAGYAQPGVAPAAPNPAAYQAAPFPQQQAVPPAPIQNPYAMPQAQPVVAGGPGTAPPAVGGPGVKKPAQTNPNSTQNTLQIAEVRDGIVIMSDGSYRSVVMVKSINFDLMSQGEQEAVEYGFQAFLNSLYFPIQIFVRSQKIDIQPYIEKLDKIRTEHDNMLLALLMDDYISYIDQLAQQTNIMDKKFYIVVPFFPHIDLQKALTSSKNFLSGFVELFNSKEKHVVINEQELEKAKAELRNRVQSVMNGLLQCNVQSLPLDTQELIELFYDSYNPDTATRQELKDFSALDADIITKGQGRARQPHLERELQ